LLKNAGDLTLMGQRRGRDGLCAFAVSHIDRYAGRADCLTIVVDENRSATLDVVD
jgi:hypothetical protein